MRSRSVTTSKNGLRVRLTRTACLAAGVVAVVLVSSPGTATAAARVGPPVPSVLHVGRAAAQDVRVLAGSEADTLVEPDIAVSPLDRNIAVAAAHDGRYPDGGAVGIETAWTHDGGATWHHKPLPKVTAATGAAKVWERASDPVVAFGPDGTVYISTLMFNTGCDSAVAVSASTNGGKTFGAPVFAHRSATCDVSDDKNWLVVDNQAKSPHRGRLYQFWTPFLADFFGNFVGSPQALVTSDDHGRTWSAPVSVSLPQANTQDSQPMIKPDGSLVDAFIDFGPNAAEEGPEAAGARAGRVHAVGPVVRSGAMPRAAAVPFTPVFTTAISTDGGRHWKPGGPITTDLGGPDAFRCCLMSATADPSTGLLYASWNSIDATKVKISRSSDGRHWSSPVTVNRPDRAHLGVNSDVVASGGTVSVSYGLTNTDATHGRFGRQFVSTSYDRGLTFGGPVALGPQINYAYAAQSRGIFPGDYIGTAASKGRMYAVWMVSSAPAAKGAKFHQVMWAAQLDTVRSPVSSSPTG